MSATTGASTTTERKLVLGPLIKNEKSEKTEVVEVLLELEPVAVTEEGRTPGNIIESYILQLTALETRYKAVMAETG